MSDLDREMRGLLARLEMLSHGSVQAWNASGGHSGEHDDKMVAIVARRVEEAPHVFYRRVYFAAETKNRERIYEEALGVYKAWVRTPLPPQRDDDGEEKNVTLEGWILEDGKGWEPELVARRFNVDPAFVRRIRQRKQRNTETGLPLDGTVVARDERAERAKELHAKGLTLRQIALHLGTDPTTVRRDLAA